jgi:hypothetical protein
MFAERALVVIGSESESTVKTMGTKSRSMETLADAVGRASFRDSDGLDHFGGLKRLFAPPRGSIPP